MCTTWACGENLICINSHNSMYLMDIFVFTHIFTV